MQRIHHIALLVLCSISIASAHQQPTTIILLSASSNTTTATLHIPLSELELAFGHQVSVNPAQSLPTWRVDFEAYLLHHIHPVSPASKPWLVHIDSIEIEASEQTQSGPFQEAIVQLTLTPPPGESSRSFTLHYDLILHQVVTHKALVSVENDWAGGRLESAQLGVISVDTGTAKIAPLEINLGPASSFTGFRAMISLGMHHIQEGTDHMLFLIVLLLSATSSRASMLRLIGIVSAFSLGHTVTLLAGALEWLRLPQQPVEVLIAFSILVTAVHAIRPIFAGRELLVAAGFGLIHGLGFATALAPFHLPPLPMALSILGFNLGIELMQLFIIAITVPWLILLSLTPVHAWVRISGALLASIAAIGWIANRITGQPNAIESTITLLSGYAPLGILALALIAIPAYLFSLNDDTLPAQRTNP